MSTILLVEQIAPATPSTNQVIIYPKAGGRLYLKEDTGTEYNLTLPAITTTDNAVIRADGTSGDLQNSGVIIDDSNNVTGISSISALTTDLAVAEGGTGASTAAAARTNLDVPSNAEAILDTIIDAAGDLIYGTAADTAARLAIGTAFQKLRTNSGATAPEWNSLAPTVQVFTANGTYTRPAGLVAAMIYVKGGGGGGGGSSSATPRGGGGGEGQEAWKLATAATIGASQVVTIGGGGANVAANTNAAGSTGTTSSFGTIVTAVGGIGGTPGNNGGAGGAGGSGGAGEDWEMPGDRGQYGTDATASVFGANASGGGKGGGAAGGSAVANSGGGGGSGSTGAGSGAGGSGIITIIEYY